MNNEMTGTKMTADDMTVNTVTAEKIQYTNDCRQKVGR
jgi:hypothetical protein